MFVYIYAAYQTFIKNQGKNYEIFIEFVLWLLGIFFFLLLLVSVYDLICMFFLIIGLNICFYGLLIQNSILKKNLSEVCLKYFLLSALSSIFIGGGCLFIFYICGTTNFLLINNFLIYKILFLQSSFEILIIKFGIFLLFFGFLFKLSLVPAHF
jgi:NADH:ubiquinone oxidoreductase subunit 2 (subunit N)